MLVFPIVAALIDKKVRSGREGQVKAKPLVWPEDNQFDEESMLRPESPLGKSEFVEGGRSVVEQSARRVEEKKERRGLVSSMSADEKKKLILYSEILKPKFDD